MIVHSKMCNVAFFYQTLNHEPSSMNYKHHIIVTMLH